MVSSNVIAQNSKDILQLLALKFYKGEDVKNRWVICRKGLVRQQSRSTYYLSEELAYLRPHLKINESSADSRDLKQSNNLLNKDEDNADFKNDNILTCKNMNRTSLDAKGMEIPSTSRYEEEKKKSDHVKNKAVPQVSKKYLEKGKKLEQLEMQAIQVTELAMQEIKNVVQSLNHDEDLDDFSKAIKQSLTYIPNNCLLQCTNGILDIIDRYISDDKEN